MTIRVGVFGAAGRMGRLVCQAVADDPELRLVGAVDPHHAGFDLRHAAGVDVADVTVDPDPSVLAERGVDVVVDFTLVDAARHNVAWAADNGVHAVVGTSGFGEDDFTRIRKAFRRSNCLVAPNFAIGAVLMMRFAELAAPYFDSTEIIELHHDQKVDAPSGTAMNTARRMAGASERWTEDPTSDPVLPGARGGSGPAGIPVHSVRMRGLVAHQEVLLGTTGQALTVRHDSYDRSSFMPGVVLAVKHVGERPGLTVGLDTILGL